MPSPILPPPSSEDTNGTIIERVLGRDGKARSTKTWIPSTTLINRMSVLGNHAARLTSTFRTLATQEAITVHLASHEPAMQFSAYAQRCACGWVPPEFTDGQLADRFTGIKAYAGLHQQVLDKLGSYKGFLVRTVFGQATQTEAPEAPSSAGAAVQPVQQVRPMPPVPATPTAAPPQAMNGHAKKLG